MCPDTDWEVLQSDDGTCYAFELCWFDILRVCGENFAEARKGLDDFFLVFGTVFSPGFAKMPEIIFRDEMKVSGELVVKQFGATNLNEAFVSSAQVIYFENGTFSGPEARTIESERKIWLYSFRQPVMTAPQVAQNLGIAPGTARKNLNSLSKMKLL